jgi:outer membrane protein assembly factor BamD
MKRLLFLFLLALSFTSCSEYNKVLKGNDYELKEKLAQEYFETKKYMKAVPLYEDLISFHRGSAKSEEFYYNFAYCYYYMKDYYLAAFYFQNFVRSYPNSKYVEDASWMNAYCHYKNSPEFSLDQTDTKTAMSMFQIFLNTYHETSLRDTTNYMIDKMRFKLERKSFEIAKLYYHMENYQSASVALKNTLKDFPATRYKEEILFLVLKSDFLLASNSVEKKKEERFRQTLKSYYTFVDNFSRSQYMKEAEKIYAETLKILEEQYN